MIRTLRAILPADSRRLVVTQLALTVLSVLLRATGVVALVPLLSSLFGPEPGAAWPWVGLLAAVTVAGWMVDWLGARVGYELGFGLLHTGQQSVADQVARIRLPWFTGATIATTRQAIAATGPELVGLSIYLVVPLITAVLLPIAIALALVPIAWPLGLAALAGVPILLGAYWLAGWIGRKADTAAQEANSALTERIVEFARTQHALRAARRVDPERSQVGAALARQHSATIRLLLMQIPSQLLFSLASQLALILLAGTTVALTARGELTVPAAIALIVVIVRYLEPFTVLAELSGGVESSVGTLRRIREVLDAPAVAVGPEEFRPVAPPRLELRRVSFAYGPDEPQVLNEFDLTLEAGTTTAIVGPSGSGKSSILGLLAGLQEPTSGQVLIDGSDARTLDAESRRALVSVVFQEPYLFDGTIRENVLAGDPAAESAAVAEVGGLARLDSTLARLPKGWDSRVGEAGTSLSGGERQRVSIARALLKPAPLLLVDEATSALDTENEAAVAAALTADQRERTRVIVAHRLTSIQAADRVIFLDRGQIVEDGTIDELLATTSHEGRPGRFAEFWHQQHAASAWQLGAR